MLAFGFGVELPVGMPTMIFVRHLYAELVELGNK